MKVFLLACISAAIIALAAVECLDAVQQPAAQAFSTVGVRL